MGDPWVRNKAFSKNETDGNNRSVTYELEL